MFLFCVFFFDRKHAVGSVRFVGSGLCLFFQKETVGED